MMRVSWTHTLPKHIKGLSKPPTLYPTTAAGTAGKRHANYGTPFLRHCLILKITPFQKRHFLILKIRPFTIHLFCVIFCF
jgi:hypothetical protein